MLICLFQGKYFMFIEVVSQIYRMLVPIIPWLHFLYDQPKSGRLIFAAILVIIYLLLKVSTEQSSEASSDQAFARCCA